MALQGEFGVNHYVNELARGPGEEEEEEEGLGLGSVCLNCSVPVLGVAMATDHLQTGGLFFLRCYCCGDRGVFKMASLWMLHGAGVQVERIGHVLELERWMDLKSLFVTFFSVRLGAPFFSRG